MERRSDLIGAAVVAAIGVGIVVILGAFFFVGALAGVIALLVGVILFAAVFARAIRKADLSE
jgi:hypothetical protein